MELYDAVVYVFVLGTLAYACGVIVGKRALRRGLATNALVMFVVLVAFQQLAQLRVPNPAGLLELKVYMFWMTLLWCVAYTLGMSEKVASK